MPDFSQQSYWDTRFTHDPQPFDWLLSAQNLCTITRDMIGDDEILRNSEILHIGCGTSEAGFLRTLVREPGQVHNVDYSEAGVRAGEQREKEWIVKEQEVEASGSKEEALLVEEDKGGDESQSESKTHEATSTSTSTPAFHDVIKTRTTTMRWSCMDLLSLPSTLALLHHNLHKLYDLILDKSTSDSISCGQNTTIPLPYPLSINGWTRRLQNSGTQTTGAVHPLHLLAIHLAALTTPRTARWLCVSYSEDRFPFLPPFPQSHGAGMLDDGVIKAGFPHPYQLWRLERKERVEIGGVQKAEEDETLAERRKRLSLNRNVHRPKVSHWVYVLRRTEAVVTD